MKITVNRTQVSDNSNTPQGISNFRPNLQGHDKKGTIQVLRHQRGGWVGSKNGNS